MAQRTIKASQLPTSLMDLEGVWIFPFEVAQDITDTLRKQLAYLFMDALHLRRRVKVARLPESLAQLQGAALRLVIDRPIAWEQRLFSEVLYQEIYRARHEKMDLDYQITFGKSERFENFEIFGWLVRKSGELQRLIENADRIVNVALQEALGPPGVPGDAEAIVYVGKKLGDLYRKAIEWTINFHRVEVDEDFQRIVTLTSTMTRNMIKEIEEYSKSLKSGLEEALANLPPAGERRELQFTLTLTMPDMEEFHAEVENLQRRHRL